MPREWKGVRIDAASFERLERLRKATGNGSFVALIDVLSQITLSEYLALVTSLATKRRGDA